MPPKLTAPPAARQRGLISAGAQRSPHPRRLIEEAARHARAHAMAYVAWVGGYEALALEALYDAPEEIRGPALYELAVGAPQEGVRIQALRALSKRDDPLAAEAIEAALSCASGPVRLEALRRANAHQATSVARLVELAQRDPAPLIRRAALRGLSLQPSPEAQACLWRALDDPVWRVRRAATRLLEDLARATVDPLAWAQALDQRPDQAPRTAPGRRARQHLLDRLHPTRPPPPAPPAPPAWAQRPFWSDDPAVLVSNVKHLDEAAQIAHLDALLDLIGFQDGYPLNDQLVAMRALIARRLIASGDLQQWRRALAWLDAPRVPFASAWAAALAEAAPAKVARAILAEGGPPGAEAQTAWAIQAQPTAISWATWRDHPSPRLRRAALRAASPRLDDATLAAAAMDEALSEIALDAWAARRPAAPPPLPPSKQALLATHPRFAAQIDEADWRTWAAATDPTQRADVARGLARTGLHPALLDALQHDPHHRVRAAAMTPERAQALRVDPLQEPSWRVLAAAAAILNAPLSAWASQTTRALKPKPVERRWQTDSYFSLAPLAAPYRRGPRASQRATPRATRPFAGRLASALVVSGRHALPEAGYDLALEAGVNAFFWEPEYTQLTRWARALPDDLRRSLIWIGGTFSHEPQHVLRDLEQMRRALDIDEVAAFILFWVRDTARLEDEIIEALMEAQDQGRLSVFGFSTHDRGFALEGLAAGWPLVMVRHSAGHPSAEEAVLPTAAALGASVITFSNLCYGLMLDPREGQPPPYEAADCYRYALSQPGVTLTLTAPATIKALKENLNVLDQPTLDEAMMDTMRVWAAPIREETRRLLRQIRAQ